MKVLGFPFFLQAASLAIFLATPVHAEDAATASKKPAPYSKQALQSRIDYCQTCHGLSGEGVSGGSRPVPRLAGQQIKYLENQLGNFIVHRRQDVAMSNVVHDMSPALVAALAAYYNGLNPKPPGGAPKELVAAGKEIYEGGVASANVPACATCHGPDAKGNGVFPRLAGQLHSYISMKLTNWEKERGRDPTVPDKSANVMQPVAHNLTEVQVAAIAAYLSYLE
jgi:cytochrome c553